ncbi:MAG TPA: hypothetical protein VK832_01485, partial [Burkholderiaceae bacterium]|nr:hypothetical protein [Burkholderiaceae bacterium]
MITGNTKPNRPRTLTTRRAEKNIGKKIISPPVDHPVLPEEGDATPSDKEERDVLSPQFMAKNMTSQGLLVQEMIKEGPN